MTSTSERVLAGLPLFAGLELGELAAAVEPVELAPGEELWRQGAAGDALYVVERGRVEVAARLPGARELGLATLGPGEVLGELALLDGGARTAGVRALEPARLLRLGRADLRRLALGRDDGAGLLRRRLLELACARLRDRHRALAATLPGAATTGSVTRGEPVEPPERSYLLRLPFFRGLDARDLDALLAAATVERVERGATLVAEGQPPRGLFVTLRGAVEEAIRHDGGAIRVGLAGPGRAFGHVGAIGGGEATASAAARERAIVLVVEPPELERLLAADALAGAVERDLVAALRQAERPQARVAARG